MHRSFIAVAISAALILSASHAFAQRGQGGSKGKGPHVQAPKGQGGGHVQSGPKGTSGHTPKATKPVTTRGPKHAAPTTTTATTTAATTKGKGRPAATSTTTTTATGTTTTLTPVQLKLQQNTNLASKVQTRLPSGTNLITAAEGFRNLGQFVAAVNVSNNLGIPFSQLKTRMVDDGMSLGQAIQSVRADVNTTTVTTEVRRAERDAIIIIEDAERRERTNKAKKNKGGGQ